LDGTGIPVEAAVQLGGLCCALRDLARCRAGLRGMTPVPQSIGRNRCCGTLIVLRDSNLRSCRPGRLRLGETPCRTLPSFSRDVTFEPTGFPIDPPAHGLPVASLRPRPSIDMLRWRPLRLDHCWSGLGSRHPASKSRSVLVVLHHLDGFLRLRSRGLVASRCRSWGSRRCPSTSGPKQLASESFGLGESAFPAARFTPFEEVSPPAAASRCHDRCPLAVPFDLVRRFPAVRCRIRSSSPLRAVVSASRRCSAGGSGVSSALLPES